MDASTKRLLWIAGGVAAVAVIARASYMAGRRQAKLYAAPAPAPTSTLQPISVNGVDTLNQGSPGPLVTVILAGAAVPANVPKGGRLAIYPPDVVSRILSYADAAGNSGLPSSPAGPLVVAPINGSGTLNVSWQDAAGAAHVTAVNIAAV